MTSTKSRREDGPLLLAAAEQVDLALLDRRAQKAVGPVAVVRIACAVQACRPENRQRYARRCHRLNQHPFTHLMHQPVERR